MHTPERMYFLRACVKPFRIIYSDYKKARDQYLYECTFNGSVIALQTALNDRFDPLLRDIVVEDATYDSVYLYKRTELQPALSMYRRWNATTFASATSGVFCVKSGVVYQANASVVGTDVPGVSAKWDVVTGAATYFLRTHADYNANIKFTIKVPSTVTFNFNELKALVNFYKMAGPGYQVVVI